MGKRGCERIERLWDEREAVDPKQEQFASAALDKHDTIVRLNLGMSDNQPAASNLNLNVSAGRGRILIGIGATAYPDASRTSHLRLSLNILAGRGRMLIGIVQQQPSQMPAQDQD